MREIDEITGEIVDAAYRLHTRLGPGPLESVYEVVLAAELARRGLTVERQKPVPFEFKEGLRRIVNKYQPSASPRLRVSRSDLPESHPPSLRNDVSPSGRRLG